MRVSTVLAFEGLPNFVGLWNYSDEFRAASIGAGNLLKRSFLLVTNRNREIGLSPIIRYTAPDSS